MTKQKIIIFGLIFATLAFWTATLILPRIGLWNKNQQFNNGKITNQNATPSEELFSLPQIEQKYTAAASEGKKFVTQTLKAPYLPSNDISKKFGGYNLNSNIGRAAFKTQPWEANNTMLYAVFYTTIKGSQYSQDNKPLQNEIFIDTKNADKSLPELFQQLPTYFTMPAESLDNSKEIQLSSNRSALETTWKENDILESRSVYQDKNGVTYLVACQIYPDSPSYTKNSCY